ncbi:MAG: GNAT family N-acetyltransferase [Alphaproteobacteria bacterium]
MTAPIGAAGTVRLDTLGARSAEGRLGELADLLVDAVAHGASVNFMAGFGHAEGRAFWSGQLPAIGRGATHLHIAEHQGRIVGTALLMFAHQPNAPHRADVGKMLVHSSARRHGIGRSLLAAVEAAAAEAGRTLLLLDTEADSAGERLYRACGWIAFGSVPGHAFRPDGRLAETVYFYKWLADPSRARRPAD